jgi:uncharacterized membrane protein HdeD (DUF308 family)
MSTEPTESVDASDDEAVLETVIADRRRMLQAVGLFLALLGLVAIAVPFVTELSLSLLLGAALIVGGVLQFVHAFSAAAWRGSLVQVFLGVLYTIAGMVLMANPMLAIASLTLLVVAFLVVEGIALIALSFTVRTEPNWEWNVFSGLLSLLFASLVWIGLPSSELWAIGLLMGLDLLTTGAGLVFLGRGEGAPAEEPAETVA